MIRHCMTCIARLCYASTEEGNYDALFTLLSTICYRAHIDQSGTRCWADEGFEKLKWVCRRFFSSLGFFPTFCFLFLLNWGALVQTPYEKEKERAATQAKPGRPSAPCKQSLFLWCIWLLEKNPAASRLWKKRYVEMTVLWIQYKKGDTQLCIKVKVRQVAHQVELIPVSVAWSD